MIKLNEINISEISNNNNSKIKDINLEGLQYIIEKETPVYIRNSYIDYNTLDFKSEYINEVNHETYFMFILTMHEINSNNKIVLSHIVTQFVDHFTSDQCNINFKLTEEECNTILKDILENLPRDIEISEVYNFNSEKRSLIITISKRYNSISFNLPLICPPRDWELNDNKENGIKGGYLHNKYNYINLLTEKNTLNSTINIKDKLITTVNELQRIKLNVNSIIETYEIHRKQYIKDYRKLRNMQKHYNNMTNKEIVREFHLFKQSKINNKLPELKAYYIMKKNIINYKLTTFYFTYNICFRGRIYIPGLISPTSDKILRRNILVNDRYGNPIHSEIIELDATASVLQILSVISCSTKLAKITNILSDQIMDTWTVFHDEIINRSKEDLQSSLNELFNNSSTKKFDLDDIYGNINIINREIVKKTIMRRILYGSNFNQIAKDFRKELSINKLSYKHIAVIYASFASLFPIEVNTLKIIKLLQKGSMNYSNKGLTIENSFISFNNTYYSKHEKTCKFTDNKGKYRTLHYYIIDKVKIDKRKGTNSCAANFFHNKDSEICLSVIHAFTNNNMFLLTVHDAFIIFHKDRDKLLKYYNNSLYSLNSSITTTIDKTIESIKLPKKDKQFITDYKNKLLARQRDFRLHKNRILNSPYTLKRDFSTSNDKPTIIKYSIKLPDLDEDINNYLNLLKDELT